MLLSPFELPEPFRCNASELLTQADSLLTAGRYAAGGRLLEKALGAMLATWCEAEGVDDRPARSKGMVHELRRRRVFDRDTRAFFLDSLKIAKRARRRAFVQPIELTTAIKVASAVVTELPFIAPQASAGRGA